MVNMTILAAIFLKWKTQRSLQTIYKILACLSLSRCLCLLSYLFYYTILVFHPWILLDIVIVTAMVVKVMFLHFTNAWFATILCVFYCVKITSYSNVCCIFLKMKISTRVSWFLLASLFISLLSTLPFGFDFFTLESKNLLNGTMENTTIPGNVPVNIFQKQFMKFFVGTCPPFVIFCVTICLLLHSLWMHTRRMRSSGSNFSCPNLESHYSAVKSMSLFLVLQVIYFIFANVDCQLKSLA
ncbi:taste receptor type 2 member 39-like [Eleutherodactylus coqui]|uniref:taste receptor type 2 member 39-like n=1 Tax=Eleutherodactylus coqui TaxID=57060 RepID=UPI0034620381